MFIRTLQLRVWAVASARRLSASLDCFLQNKTTACCLREKSRLLLLSERQQTALLFVAIRFFLPV